MRLLGIIFVHFPPIATQVVRMFSFYPEYKENLQNIHIYTIVTIFGLISFNSAKKITTINIHEKNYVIVGIMSQVIYLFQKER